MWPNCLKRGIAAIDYYDRDDEHVVGDCAKLTEDEYKEAWRRSGVWNPTGQSSLGNLAYRMEEGDVIYVKEGTSIVGKGVVRGNGGKKRAYRYDPDILKGTMVDWAHYVKVDWQKDFRGFELLLGAEPLTVLSLDDERLSMIWEKEFKPTKEDVDQEADEGEQYRKEAAFRRRNWHLIQEKKSRSDYRCEVCRMSFEKVYGPVGAKYIIAHHKEPIGSRDGPTKTTLDDIALVCANCHGMLHRTKPPMSIKELREALLGR